MQNPDTIKLGEEHVMHQICKTKCIEELRDVSDKN